MKDQDRSHEALRDQLIAARPRLENASRLSPQLIALSALLRQARYEAGLSVEDLAQRAGLPQATVRQIEAGTLQPAVDVFKRALDACEPTADVTNQETDSP